MSIYPSDRCDKSTHNKKSSGGSSIPLYFAKGLQKSPGIEKKVWRRERGGEHSSGSVNASDFLNAYVTVFAMESVCCYGYNVVVPLTSKEKPRSCHDDDTGSSYCHCGYENRTNLL